MAQEVGDEVGVALGGGVNMGGAAGCCSDDNSPIGVAMDVIPMTRLGEELVEAETWISFKDGDLWGLPRIVHLLVLVR
ncbi:hypothetical protein U1Q18_021111 [Sarracenia purpurea var. burkii]